MKTLHGTKQLRQCCPKRCAVEVSVTTAHQARALLRRSVGMPWQGQDLAPRLPRQATGQR